jgi:hypothetical protein
MTVLIIDDEKRADWTADGPTRFCFVMLPMNFNVRRQTFASKRANGTRILLHIRVHHVTC